MGTSTRSKKSMKVLRRSRASALVLRIALAALIVPGIVVIYRIVWRGGRGPLDGTALTRYSLLWEL